MKIKTYGYLFGFFFLLLSCSPRHYVVIENVTVFDGESVHLNANFVFSDSLIIAITQDPVRYRYCSFIDGQGKTIIPPLINAHVHVREPDNLREAMDSGIFALLDMFSTNKRANYLRSFNDSLDYAHFYSSNEGATVAGGHGTQFGVGIPLIGENLSPEAFVKDRLGENADYIKITQEETMATLSSAQLEALAGAAEHHGLQTVGHISDLDNALLLTRAGVGGLAHIWYRGGSKAGRGALTEMKDHHLFVIPTLSVVEKVIEKAETIGVADAYLTFDAVKAEVGKLHAAGIRLLAGTDAPNYGMDYAGQLFEEMQLLQACGLSNTEVLKAATSNIYETFELEAFGHLKKGNPASFLLIDGRPLQKLEDLKKEKRRWKKGVELLKSSGKSNNLG